MYITLALCMEMIDFKSMFIGVTARSQVRQRVLPEGLQCLKIWNDAQSKVDNLRAQWLGRRISYVVVDARGRQLVSFVCLSFNASYVQLCDLKFGARDMIYAGAKEPHIPKLYTEPETYARTTTVVQELEILLTNDFWYFLGELNRILRLSSLRMSEGS